MALVEFGDSKQQLEQISGKQVQVVPVIWRHCLHESLSKLKCRGAKMLIFLEVLH